jgi:predicted alpha/beta-hydrolase family hydrolase
MPASFLVDGPEGALITVLLAHGAGAPVDSASMSAIAGSLAAAGLRVARFEFGYMAARRSTGERRPPPRAETLIPEYRAAVAALNPSGRLVIGGKSMGGRVASMIADALHGEGKVAGLLCLGYPFHPPGKPERPRTGHLRALATPTLICQGTRDPFGTREDVGGYALSDRIEILWVEDGDHDLRPRKQVTGVSAAAALQSLADAVAAWTARITG